MNKYIEEFCKQNPIFKFNCQNPRCKKLYSFKSNEVFSKNTYVFKCSKCGFSTTIDASNFEKDFTQLMKKTGITVQ